MGISVWQLIIIFVLIPLIFLPTIIAIKKNHPYKIAIILINIFGGMLWGVGWLVALVWCFIGSDKVETVGRDSAEEIEKLYDLMEKGVLTQEEFDRKKTLLLEN